MFLNIFTQCKDKPKITNKEKYKIADLFEGASDIIFKQEALVKNSKLNKDLSIFLTRETYVFTIFLILKQYDFLLNCVDEEIDPISNEKKILIMQIFDILNEVDSQTKVNFDVAMKFIKECLASCVICQMHKVVLDDQTYNIKEFNKKKNEIYEYGIKYISLDKLVNPIRSMENMNNMEKTAYILFNYIYSYNREILDSMVILLNTDLKYLSDILINYYCYSMCKIGKSKIITNSDIFLAIKKEWHNEKINELFEKIFLDIYNLHEKVKRRDKLSMLINKLIKIDEKLEKKNDDVLLILIIFFVLQKYKKNIIC